MIDFFKKIWYNNNNNIICGTRGRAMMDAISLSNFVLTLFQKDDTPITNLKLQKVLYYIQGYYYKWLDRPAFLDEIYCWQYGPVVPTVYYKYNDNGSMPLKPDLSFDDFIINDREKRVIDAVVKKCASISTSKLVSMTHSENPWRNSKSDNIINKNSIELYFKFNDPLEIVS